MRSHLLVGLALAVSLLAWVSIAQAVVVDMSPGASGQSSVTYPTDQGSYFGVALVPGTSTSLQAAEIPTVSSSAPCTDPALTPELSLSNTGICYHGGTVLHANETFALTWDPHRRYFATTKDYVEQFLKDVADSSGTFGSPYALTSQYTDHNGRAGNTSLYGGACVDMGTAANATCDFTTASGAGHGYPSNECRTISGTTDTWYVKITNDTCLTAAQIQTELSAIVTQTNIIGHTQPGYTPTLVLLMPPGVETCLDAAAKLCSASTESAAPAQFCSYHSRLTINGAVIPYIVQPWTALASKTVKEIVEGKEVEKEVPLCDEPDAPAIPEQTDAHTLEVDLGIRLVSPLSQSHIAAIVNPEMNGWFALDGSGINENGCVPLSKGLDSVTVGKNSYLLQREFNNASVMELEPYAHRCMDGVVLEPTFVLPSPVNQGTVVEFDGSTSPSSLIVPNVGYAWEFGDGTTAVGPSVEHTYAKGGTYSVKLTLTDRGGYVRSTTQTITVIGPPTNTGLPTISDLTSLDTSNIATGDTLEASTGSWTDNPTSYTYQWQDCNAAGEACSNIPLATTPIYTVASGDSGHTVRVVVGAYNSAGSGTAASAQTATVGAPYNTTAPTIGYASVPSEGSQMSVSSTGAWLRSPTAFAYQWQDCNAVGGACAPIAGATGATYTPVAADVGHTVRVEVIAINGVGLGRATSAPTSVVGTRQASTAGGSSTGSNGTNAASAGLDVKLVLVPESRKMLLRRGVVVKATANQPADGVASISITRSEAKQAGIAYGHRQSSVVVGRGTVKGLIQGTMHFDLRLSKNVTAKLGRLHRVVVTVTLTALNSSGQRQTIAVAGRY